MRGKAHCSFMLWIMPLEAGISERSILFRYKKKRTNLNAIKHSDVDEMSYIS